MDFNPNPPRAEFVLVAGWLPMSKASLAVMAALALSIMSVGGLRNVYDNREPKARNRTLRLTALKGGENESYNI